MPVKKSRFQIVDHPDHPGYVFIRDSVTGQPAAGSNDRYGIKVSAKEMLRYLRSLEAGGHLDSKGRDTRKF